MSSSSRVVLRAVLVLSVLSVRGETGPGNYTFPNGFMFGVATAAYQIEGAWNEGGKGESMWDTFLHKHPDYTPDLSNADVAADSYHKYMDDIAIIKELGVEYYRLSISWPRLLPNGTDNNISKTGARYYRKVITELLKANVTPVITLFHWDLPTPLMDLGGWANPNMVDYFRDYARVAFNLYGDVVKIWTTMNEPHQHCYNGYGSDYFAPALKSHGVGEYLCIHYVLLAHAAAYHLYDKEYRPTQKGKIGITLDAFWAKPKNSSNPDDIQAAERYLQMHAKKDNAKKTGTGGGKAKKMSPLDDIVLEIIGEDSPILEGLGMRDTMTSSSQNIEAKTEEVDVSIPSPNIKPSCSTQKTEVDASPQNIRQVNSNKKYKRFVTSQSKSHEDHLDLQSLKKRKLQAQLEFLDLQNYKTKLEIYEMEERLNIPHSDVTKILKD